MIGTCIITNTYTVKKKCVWRKFDIKNHVWFRVDVDLNVRQTKNMISFEFQSSYSSSAQ